MQRLTIPLHDFVTALRRAIADKDIGYTDHLIHDFVFCDESACAKLDRLPAPVQTFSSPCRETNVARPAFARHTNREAYVLRYNNEFVVDQNQPVWEK